MDGLNWELEMALSVHSWCLSAFEEYPKLEAQHDKGDYFFLILLHFLPFLFLVFIYVQTARGIYPNGLRSYIYICWIRLN